MSSFWGSVDLAVRRGVAWLFGLWLPEDFEGGDWEHPLNHPDPEEVACYLRRWALMGEIVAKLNRVDRSLASVWHELESLRDVLGARAADSPRRSELVSACFREDEIPF